MLEQQEDGVNELFPNLLRRDENGNERTTAASGTYQNSVMLTNQSTNNKGSGIGNMPSFGAPARQTSNMSDGTPNAVIVDGDRQSMTDEEMKREETIEKAVSQPQQYLQDVEQVRDTF